MQEESGQANGSPFFLPVFQEGIQLGEYLSGSLYPRFNKYGWWVTQSSSQGLINQSSMATYRIYQSSRQDSQKLEVDVERWTCVDLRSKENNVTVGADYIIEAEI